MVYHVAQSLQSELKALQRKPARSLWKRATQTFLQRLRMCTQGMFGDYSMKIALDGILLSAPHLERVLSWWPMRCNADQEKLPLMYPAVANNSQEDLMLV